MNTVLTNSRNNRWAMTFSNKIELLPSVDGHGQYEKLRLYEGAVNRPWGLSRCGSGVSERAGNYVSVLIRGIFQEHGS